MSKASCPSPPPPEVSSSPSPQAAATREPTSNKVSRISLGFITISFRPRPLCPLPCPTPPLIDVHGRDEHCSHRDLLPERTYSQDDEPVSQDGRNEHPYDRAEYRAGSSEQAGTADDHCRNRLEIVGRMPLDRGC